MTSAKYIRCAYCHGIKEHPKMFPRPYYAKCRECLIKDSKGKDDFNFWGEFYIPIIQGWFVYGYEIDWTLWSNLFLTAIFTFLLSFWSIPAAIMGGLMWHIGQEIGQGMGAPWAVRKDFDPHGFDFLDLIFGLTGGFGGILAYLLITL